MARAVLALEDGSCYWGESFGGRSAAGGEVVFNTSMTGYQEIASDPSYNGQIVVMTYPLIGSYGAYPAASESRRPWIEAMVVSELMHPEREGVDSFGAYLAAHDVPGLSGVDTRSLARRLRGGRRRGYLTQIADGGDRDALVAEAAIARALAVSPLEDRDVVSEVVGPGRTIVGPVGGPPVAVVDAGIKENQVRVLVERGATVRVLDPSASVAEILANGTRGVMLSNGPGDPATLDRFVATAAELIRVAESRGGELAILGICLGHQVLARAIGATTSRLPFGHHGGNHPVRELDTGRVAITTQNHEFRVDESSIPSGSGFVVSHRNLNDGSVEGMAHRTLPILSLQFHPEAAPGPRDSLGVFDRFVALAGA